MRDSLRHILLYRADQRALTLAAQHGSCTRDIVYAGLVDYLNRGSRLAGDSAHDPPPNPPAIVRRTSRSEISAWRQSSLR